MSALLVLLAGAALGQGNGNIDGLDRSLITGTLTELADIAARHTPLDELRVFDQPLLIHAARNFDADRLSVIIDAHATLDIADATGTTAVMHALMAGRVENARLLARRGASLQGVNDRGYTVRVLAGELGLDGFGPEYPLARPGPVVPVAAANDILLLAAEAGDIALFEWAVSLGADLGARAGNGLQAAHLAALGGHAAAFDFILSHPTAPPVWSTVAGASSPLNVIDFVIAGEGGGDRARAVAMLHRAAASGSLGPLIDAERSRFRAAMTRIGYDSAQIAAALGVAPPAPLTLDIPASAPPGGPTPEDWRAVQRMLQARGLYEAEIDGVVGRGTLRGVILHVLDTHVPTLIDGAEAARLMADDRTQGPAGSFGWVQLWRLDGMTGRWASGTLSTGAGPDQAVQGFITVLPDGVGPGTAPPGPGSVLLHSQAPQLTQPPRTGQLALTLWPDGAGRGARIALSVPVLGSILDARIFEDRIVYRWGVTGRRYDIEEAISLPDRLRPLLEVSP